MTLIHKICLPLFLAACALCCFSCISEEVEESVGNIELRIGETLPDFTVQLNDGSHLSTNDLKGGVSMIVFFHTQCRDCQKELPVIQRIYDTCPYPIQLVCISRNEEADAIQRYWKQNHLTLPYSAQKDANIYHLFAKSRIPRIYVSDVALKIGAIHTDNPIATYEDLMEDIHHIMGNSEKRQEKTSATWS